MGASWLVTCDAGHWLNDGESCSSEKVLQGLLTNFSRVHILTYLSFFTKTRTSNLIAIVNQSVLVAYCGLWWSSCGEVLNVIPLITAVLIFAFTIPTLHFSIVILSSNHDFLLAIDDWTLPISCRRRSRKGFRSLLSEIHRQLWNADLKENFGINSFNRFIVMLMAAK